MGQQCPHRGLGIHLHPQNQDDNLVTSPSYPPWGIFLPRKTQSVSKKPAISQRRQHSWGPRHHPSAFPRASSSHRGESRRRQDQSHQHPKAPLGSQSRSSHTIPATLASPSSVGGKVTSHAPVRQLKPEKAAASQAASDFALNLASLLLFVMIKATKV